MVLLVFTRPRGPFPFTEPSRYPWWLVPTVVGSVAVAGNLVLLWMQFGA